MADSLTAQVWLWDCAPNWLQCLVRVQQLINPHADAVLEQSNIADLQRSVTPLVKTHEATWSKSALKQLLDVLRHGELQGAVAAIAPPVPAGHPPTDERQLLAAWLVADLLDMLPFGSTTHRLCEVDCAIGAALGAMPEVADFLLFRAPRLLQQACAAPDPGRSFSLPDLATSLLNVAETIMHGMLKVAGGGAWELLGEQQPLQAVPDWVRPSRIVLALKLWAQAIEPLKAHPIQHEGHAHPASSYFMDLLVAALKEHPAAAGERCATAFLGLREDAAFRRTALWALLRDLQGVAAEMRGGCLEQGGSPACFLKACFKESLIAGTTCVKHGLLSAPALSAEQGDSGWAAYCTSYEAVAGATAALLSAADLASCSAAAVQQVRAVVEAWVELGAPLAALLQGPRSPHHGTALLAACRCAKLAAAAVLRIGEAHAAQPDFLSQAQHSQQRLLAYLFCCQLASHLNMLTPHLRLQPLAHQPAAAVAEGQGGQGGQGQRRDQRPGLGAEAAQVALAPQLVAELALLAMPLLSLATHAAHLPSVLPANKVRKLPAVLEGEWQQRQPATKAGTVVVRWLWRWAFGQLCPALQRELPLRAQRQAAEAATGSQDLGLPKVPASLPELLSAQALAGGQTLLHLAVSQVAPADVIQELLQAGACPSTQDGSGRTAAQHLAPAIPAGSPTAVWAEHVRGLLTAQAAPAEQPPGAMGVLVRLVQQVRSQRLQAQQQGQHSGGEQHQQQHAQQQQHSPQQQHGQQQLPLPLGKRVQLRLSTLELHLDTQEAAPAKRPRLSLYGANRPAEPLVQGQGRELGGLGGDVRLSGGCRQLGGPVQLAAGPQPAGGSSNAARLQRRPGEGEPAPLALPTVAPAATAGAGVDGQRTGRVAAKAGPTSRAAQAAAAPFATGSVEGNGAASVPPHAAAAPTAPPCADASGGSSGAPAQAPAAAAGWNNPVGETATVPAADTGSQGQQGTNLPGQQAAGGSAGGGGAGAPPAAPQGLGGPAPGTAPGRDGSTPVEALLVLLRRCVAAGALSAVQQGVWLMRCRKESPASQQVLLDILREVEEGGGLQAVGEVVRQDLGAQPSAASG